MEQVLHGSATTTEAGGGKCSAKAIIPSGVDSYTAWPISIAEGQNSTKAPISCNL